MAQLEATWSVILKFDSGVSANDYSGLLARARGINFSIDGQTVEFEAISKADAESIQQCFVGLYRQSMIVKKTTPPTAQVA